MDKSENQAAWVTPYYSKLGGEIQFSRTRRDTVTNWGLTIFLAIIAAYATSVTTQSGLSVFWRIGILSAGLALSVRFFSQGMISYAFFRKWRLLQQEIESYWMTGAVSLDMIVVDVKKYEMGKRVPLTKRDMLWSQLRAGFVLNFSVLSILMVVEALRPGALGWESLLILFGLLCYLVWELATFLTYDQLKKAGPK